MNPSFFDIHSIHPHGKLIVNAVASVIYAKKQMIPNWLNSIILAILPKIIMYIGPTRSLRVRGEWKISQDHTIRNHCMIVWMANTGMFIRKLTGVGFSGLGYVEERYNDTENRWKLAELSYLAAALIVRPARQTGHESGASQTEIYGDTEGDGTGNHTVMGLLNGALMLPLEELSLPQCLIYLGNCPDSEFEMM